MNGVKILFISRKLPPQVGGMEQHSAALLEALNMPVFLIGLRKSQKQLIWWLPYAFFRALFAAPNQDIIFLQDALLTPLGLLIGKLVNKPVVVTAHGLDVTYPRWVYQRFIARNIKYTDHVITVSSATKIACLKRGVPQDRITVIPNAIETHENISEPDGRILLLGRLVKRKGAQWFLTEVMPKLPKNTRVDILGGGPLYDDLVKCAAPYPNVTVHGRVSQEKKEAIWKKSSVYLMPNIRVQSDMEGFGITAIEAGGWGIPVVAARIEGLIDAVLENESGQFFSTQDAEGCVRALHTCLSWNAQKRQQIKKIVQFTFHWPKISLAYEQVFSTIHRNN